MQEHKYLVRIDDLPSKSEVNMLLKYVLNNYCGQNRSIKAYKRMERIRIEWINNNGEKKFSCHSFVKLSRNIRENRRLDTNSNNLPSLNKNWMDYGIELRLGVPFISVTGEKTLPIELETPYGEDFPVKPMIDREGAMFSSFQFQLQQNMIRLYNKIIDDSDRMIGSSPEWISDLRMLVNDAIALVDITLHQLYFMAEYKPLEGWQFNPELLGSRIGRRLVDKFHWIGQITGKSLDKADIEIEEFKKIKALRNHLNHFDPPCFAYSIEDVAGWLNIIPRIGILLWKIRDCLELQLSDTLIQIILLPKVAINPVNTSSPRPEQGLELGYASSVWR